MLEPGIKKRARGSSRGKVSRECFLVGIAYRRTATRGYAFIASCKILPAKVKASDYGLRWPQNRKVSSETRARLPSRGVPGLFCCVLFPLPNNPMYHASLADSWSILSRFKTHVKQFLQDGIILNIFKNPLFYTVIFRNFKNCFDIMLQDRILFWNCLSLFSRFEWPIQGNNCKVVEIASHVVEIL